MICRHPEFKPVDALHSECVACGVFKGVREDAHNYSVDYYTHPSFGLFKDGIPLHSKLFASYLTTWRALAYVPELGDEINRMDKTVLAIGDGAGLLSQSLSRHGYAVDVVELSDWAIKWMKEAYGQNPYFNIIQANFEKLDSQFLRLGYDLIYANHVWEHLDDPMMALERCFGLLNPGGSLIIKVPDKEQELSFHHAHNWAFDLPCMERWFVQAGFKQTWHYVRPMNHPDVRGNVITVRGVK